MTVACFDKFTPEVPQTVYVASSAVVIGNVTLAEDVSVWPMAVIRGDIHRIEIGRGSNIQDGTVIHVTHKSDYNPEGYPVRVGEYVTIGHQVVLHGCRIGDHCLIGIGARVLDGAVIETEVMVGAATLVPPGKTLTSGYLWVGTPARKVRPLTEKEKNFLRYSADNYIKLKNQYLTQTQRI